MPELKNLPVKADLDKVSFPTATPFPEFNSKHFVDSKESGWLAKALPMLAASLISLLCGLFFVVIHNPQFLNWVPGFSQRWFGLQIIAGCLIVSYIFSFFRNWSSIKSISIFIQTNILSFFSLAYFLRLNRQYITELAFGNRLWVIDTSIVAVPLLILIFLVNYNLFGKNRRRIYLLAPQVFLFGLQTFSFISFLNIDGTYARSFSNDLLSGLFEINPIIWFILASFGVTAITVMNLKTKDLKKVSLFSVMYCFLTFQIMILINGLNIDTFSYWHRTLIFLIFWDFLSQPIYIIAANIDDKRYYPKVLASSIYHVLLTILVFLLPNLR